MDDLNFRNNNPGAVKHGNFINYYQFNPPENRLKVFPTDIWSEESNLFVALDIGCNAGDLTICLYEHLSKILNIECNILGVDLDPILIDRANEKNSFTNIKFQRLDFTSQPERDRLLSSYLQSYNVDKFSAVFCFSITMWIHINYGDEGLVNFLKEICRLGKLVVMEPQPWKCYKTAIKRLKSNGDVFDKFKSLKIRNEVENDIKEIILAENFCLIKETQVTQWGRKLLFFKEKIKD